MADDMGTFKQLADRDLECPRCKRHDWKVYQPVYYRNLPDVKDLIIVCQQCGKEESVTWVEDNIAYRKELLNGIQSSLY